MIIITPDKKDFWTYDYFFNDIFSFIDKTNIVQYSELQSYNFTCNTKVIFFVNKMFLKKDLLEFFIKKLKIVAIIHLSDELGLEKDFYEIYNKNKSIKIFLAYQINVRHNNLNLKINNTTQIMLGYANSFLGEKFKTKYSYNDIEKILNLKAFDFSFIGTVRKKPERREMLKYMLQSFPKDYFTSVNITRWDWGPKKQKITPSECHNIYKKSWFVPIGRGWDSLNCYRIYESIVSFSIPVICGSEKEVKDTFHFDQMPFKYVYSNKWKEASDKCKKMTYEEKKEIIEYNYNWYINYNSYLLDIFKH